MSKQRINAIEYIRGISMLGVIGIHTGAYSLTNPKVNIHLFALLEIFTRFSVPIFFFVSAFGLFFNHNLTAQLNYWDYMKRRLRTVLLPYWVWSLIYMIHYTWISGDFLLWSPPLVYEYFAFGLASYQLYFLVILLWFYSLMPLWRVIVRRIMINPVRDLSILLLLQIAFNYYSSYLLTPSFSNHYFNILIQHRLSYWVVHYLFIFLFGAVCAVQYPRFITIMEKRHQLVNRFFAITLAGMLTFYYYLIYYAGYTPEQAVNTDHQLSPLGVLYTVAAALFFFALFSFTKIPVSLTNVLNSLGQHSYMVYLIHPLIMYYLISYLTQQEIIMTAAITIAFFLLTVSLSLSFSIIVQKTSRFFPMLNVLLTGSFPKPENK